MRKIDKLVIMDWGGVIESHKNDERGLDAIIKSIIKRLTNSNIEINNEWGIFEIENKVYNICDISDHSLLEKWIDHIIKSYSMNCTREEFVKVYNEEFEKIEYFKDVVEILHKTKEYCKIGILSNLSKLDKERLNKQVNLNMLDYVWLSFELGEVKPNNKIYEFVEKESKVKSINILFIDDDENNIEAARKRGWNVLKATGCDLDMIQCAINKFIYK